ncbi:hypothetical protein [Jiella avicenniae]|uniref:Uncharacterized protein n=1 Tax=Jiella avicenniae TaxID=2907202 RepID=A0A9X1P330_9HYPH|nr:hypothetical protein [Jiella avicenniae]MCE7028443.1 hypothetical protein [Jiella avicenniae]
MKRSLAVIAGISIPSGHDEVVALLRSNDLAVEPVVDTILGNVTFEKSWIGDIFSHHTMRRVARDFVERVKVEIISSENEGGQRTGVAQHQVASPFSDAQRDHLKFATQRTSVPSRPLLSPSRRTSLPGSAWRKP